MEETQVIQIKILLWFNHRILNLVPCCYTLGPCCQNSKDENYNV